MKKGIILVLAMVIAVCIGVGATLAYLSVSTQDVVNTFVYGDININLEETETYYDDADSADENANTYKMIPGGELKKDPKVTVEAGSEACWLFIKVEKTNNPDNYLDYSINSCWTPLDGVDGVYYYNGTDLDQLLTAGKTYSIITGDKVTVKTTVTKTDMTKIGSAYPTLTFTAYAVQQDNVEDVETAWSIAQNNEQLPTT